MISDKKVERIATQQKSNHGLEVGIKIIFVFKDVLNLGKLRFFHFSFFVFRL